MESLLSVNSNMSSQGSYANEELRKKRTTIFFLTTLGVQLLPVCYTRVKALQRLSCPKSMYFFIL